MRNLSKVFIRQRPGGESNSICDTLVRRSTSKPPSHQRNKRSVIFKEDEDGRESVTEDRTSFDRRQLNRDQITEIARLSSSKNFIM